MQVLQARPILYVSELHTSHVSELTSAKSERLVQDLFRHLHDPRALYSHHWREGDLVIWDNIAMQHGRRFHSDTPENDASSRCTLRRVAVNAKSVEQILEGVDTGRRNLRLRIGEGAGRPAT